MRQQSKQKTCSVAMIKHADEYELKEMIAKISGQLTRLVQLRSGSDDELKKRKLSQTISRLNVKLYTLELALFKKENERRPLQDSASGEVNRVTDELVASLTQENTVLARENVRLVDENIELTNRVDDLIEQVEVLTDDNRSLRDTISQAGQS